MASHDLKKDRGIQPNDEKEHVHKITPVSVFQLAKIGYRKVFRQIQEGLQTTDLGSGTRNALHRS